MSASLSTSSCSKLSPHLLSILSESDCICFDVDSTLIKEEGIDVLGDYCNVGSIIKEYTSNAMNGTILFEIALKERLEIIKPTLSQLNGLLSDEKLHLTDGIIEVIKKLRLKNKNIYLVSGGFKQMILPIATALSIDSNSIYANIILFDESGNYLGFDINQPTSKSGGKAEVLKILSNTYKNIIMIGDGVTDLEARPPAKFMIGYGGVVIREKVKNNCDWWIEDWNDLINALDLI